MKLIPNWIIPKTISDQASACEVTGTCDAQDQKIKSAISENSIRAHKWGTISQLSMWSMFFIISGATAGMIQKITSVGMAGYLAVAGVIALTGIIGFVASQIANKINVSNSFNHSEFGAKNIAKAIEDVAEKRAKENPKEPAVSQACPPTIGTSKVDSKSVSLLNTLMEAPAASQSLN